jgi:ABC-type transport system involved in multi-copper enzyme maturation permease subunit
MVYAYGLLVLPIFAISTIALFFSVIIRGVGGAIGASLGAYFVLNLLKGFPSLSDYTINSYINYPLELVGDMAIGLPPIWSPWLYKCLAASLAYILAFGGASVLIFYKKDII